MTQSQETMLTQYVHEPSYEEEEAEYPNIAPPDDPFLYGWRAVRRIVNGSEEWDDVPLTLEDRLHPQEGDEVMHCDHHGVISMYLYAMLTYSTQDDPTTVVLFDMRLDLGLPGVKPIGPDLFVVHNVRERRNWSTFSVPEEGVVPSIVIEVTSPETRHHDIGTKKPANAPKFRWYAQAGVSTYVVIDDARRKEDQPPALLVYRRTPEGTYEPLTPNAQGRFWLEPVHLWLGPHHDAVALYDAQGNQLEDMTALHLSRDAERIRAEQEQARAEQERIRAEQEQARAEQERARADDLEARLRQMEAELRKLQGNTQRK